MMLNERSKRQKSLHCMIPVYEVKKQAKLIFSVKGQLTHGGWSSGMTRGF